MSIGTFIPVQKPIEEQANRASLEELLKTHTPVFAERKADGNRIQIHIKGNTVQYFSGSGKEWDPALFPELLHDISTLPDGIYDGELLGKAPEGTYLTKAQELKFANARRGRKKMPDPQGMKELMRLYPVKVELFDVLHIYGESVMDSPLVARKQLLSTAVNETVHISLVESRIAHTVDEILSFYEEVTGERNQEGLVVKAINTPYVSSAGLTNREPTWRKLKKFTTWDLIVLGLTEKEIGTQIIGGTYNTENGKYETFARFQFPKEELSALQRLIGEHTKPCISREQAAEYGMVFTPSRKKDALPEQLIDPTTSVVVEVGVMDVTKTKGWPSCGINTGTRYGARPPYKHIHIREDKTDALRNGQRDAPTTTQQIIRFYESLR